MDGNRDENRLITPWGYIGYSLLFSIPIIGFIFVLIYSFSSEYPCRRNYARAMLIGIVIAIVLSVLAFGVFGANLNQLTRGYYYY